MTWITGIYLVATIATILHADGIEVLMQRRKLPEFKCCPLFTSPQPNRTQGTHSTAVSVPASCI